jgi:hypothetical protein
LCTQDNGSLDFPRFPSFPLTLLFFQRCAAERAGFPFHHRKPTLERAGAQVERAALSKAFLTRIEFGVLSIFTPPSFPLNGFPFLRPPVALPLAALSEAG